MTLSRDDKRTLALQLFLHTDMTQEEIAKSVGWTAKSFTLNKVKYKWAELKAAHSTTRSSNVAGLLTQISLMLEMARKEKRPLTVKETDSIVKLSSAIEKIDRKESIGGYIQCFSAFSTYLSQVNPELAGKVVSEQDRFIQIKIQELGV